MSEEYAPNPNFTKRDIQECRELVLARFAVHYASDPEFYTDIAREQWQSMSDEQKRVITLLATSVFEKPEDRQHYIRTIMIEEYLEKETNATIALASQFAMDTVEHPPLS